MPRGMCVSIMSLNYFGCQIAGQKQNLRPLRDVCVHYKRNLLGFQRYTPEIKMQRDRRSDAITPALTALGRR